MKNISFFKRSNSASWFIQYTDEQGTRKQVSTRCKLKADALRYLAEHKSELAEPKVKPKPFSTFISDFLTYADTQYRPGTVDLYRSALDSFIGTFGSIPLNTITARHIDSWKADMLTRRTCHNQPYSATYINILFRSLKASFNTAVRWGLMKGNPCQSSKPLPASCKQPSFLTISEFELLLSYIQNPVLRDFVIFAINTGARRGEILSLKWDAVDIERRFIVIRNTSSFKTKTGKERAIPLTDAALAVIFRRKDSAIGEYVFHHNGSLIHGSTITHTFKRASRLAGLPEGIHVHSLRHSCASLLVQSGANITAVKEILGHSTINTTQIYLHNTSESLRHELEKIPSLG